MTEHVTSPLFTLVSDEGSFPAGTGPFIEQTTSYERVRSATAVLPDTTWSVVDRHGHEHHWEGGAAAPHRVRRGAGAPVDAVRRHLWRRLRG